MMHCHCASLGMTHCVGSHPAACDSLRNTLRILNGFHNLHITEVRDANKYTAAVMLESRVRVFCIIWFLDIASTAGDELKGSTSNPAPVELTTEAGEGSVANDSMPLPKG